MVLAGTTGSNGQMTAGTVMSIQTLTTGSGGLSCPCKTSRGEVVNACRCTHTFNLSDIVLWIFVQYNLLMIVVNVNVLAFILPVFKLMSLILVN